MVFGRLARSPSSEPLREDDLQPTYQGYIKDLVTRLIGIRTTVYENLVNAKYRSKNYYDKRVNSPNFRVGNYIVLLKGPKPGKFGDHYTGLEYRILIMELKKKKGKRTIQKMNNQIHIPIADVRDYHYRFAIPNRSSIRRI